MRYEFEEGLGGLDADEETPWVGEAMRLLQRSGSDTAGRISRSRIRLRMTMNKSTQNNFMTYSREEIREGICDYLEYCTSDAQAMWWMPIASDSDPTVDQ